MTKLKNKKCKDCAKATAPLENEELVLLVTDLGGGWSLVNEHHIEKEFSFPNFKEALAFTIKIGELAEEEGHHPDIHLAWGKVRVVLWTHKVNGLTESDFILAAKIDQKLTAS